MNLIGKNLSDVIRCMEEAYARVPTKGQRPPRLVAVSKEKPIEYVVEAYSHGQRHFGENKILSLLEKSTSAKIKEYCPEIKWHFIGRIQSNKVKQLTGVHNLFMVETVDSIKHAQALNTAWGLVSSSPLAVMLQVNTSGEQQKGGVNPDDVLELFHTVLSSCTMLKVVGLMCIGSFGVDNSKAPNPDFLELVRCRGLLCTEYNIPENDLELSMGMSNDFEHAIQLGSTNVRVGTTIFGERLN
ncbi:hypothetical protein EG68_02991 [Paragonimus skrjabini miyazakii]|uniref:Pyridoxal phosphate homeostasis protein n=1 Tax=Paragonimus skrjabini miyazakii TaxID=59628 RepID=A0A8S9Z2W5_9TREM|nr:hypothetical protein EG68_02991 [Paragonimus skrjabini miyazakii]